MAYEYQEGDKVRVKKKGGTFTLKTRIETKSGLTGWWALVPGGWWMPVLDDQIKSRVKT